MEKEARHKSRRTRELGMDDLDGKGQVGFGDNLGHFPPCPAVASLKAWVPSALVPSGAQIPPWG